TENKDDNKDGGSNTENKDDNKDDGSNTENNGDSVSQTEVGGEADAKQQTQSTNTKYSGSESDINFSTFQGQDSTTAGTVAPQ
ncbi:hypothetical protein G195_011491, partial [Phytophthora kernoviae 00238/432]